jgi:hypothetical protein
MVSLGKEAECIRILNLPMTNCCYFILAIFNYVKTRIELLQELRQLRLNIVLSKNEFLRESDAGRKLEWTLIPI